MNVSIFTDGSFDSSMNTNAAGAGCWIKSNYIRGQSCRYSKGFTCKDANHAEFKAIALGLGQAIKLHHECTGHVYIVTSDSDTSIDWIEGSKPCPPELKQLRDHLVKLGEQYNVKYNRIKSHRGACTPRNAVNETCDRLAKAEMRPLRDQIIATRSMNKNA